MTKPLVFGDVKPAVEAEPFCYMSETYEVALLSAPPTDPQYADTFPVYRHPCSRCEELEERNAELEATIGRWDHAFKLSALEGEVKRQAEEIARLRQDAERLNTLDMPGIEIGIDCDPEPKDDARIVVYRVSGNRNDREWTELGRGKDIRSAIDAAIRKAEGG